MRSRLPVGTDARFLRAGVGLAVAGFAVALAACTAPSAVGPAPEPEPPAAVDQSRHEAPMVALRALPSLAEPKEIAPEQYGPPIEPEFLVGLDRIALQRAIGSPSLRRREGTAEVWQYQGETCVMDAFLYATGETERLPRVIYVELRRGGVALLKEAEERRRCYAEALAEGRRNAAATAQEP